MTKNKIDLDNVLFHGLNFKFLNDSMIKFEHKRLVNILRAKAILSRKGIREKFGEDYFNREKVNWCSVNWNAEDWVSVCVRKSRREYMPDGFSEAFNLFCRGTLCLIIDKRILKKAEVRGLDGELEDGEIQIKDKVPLTYIIGIGLSGHNFTDYAKREKVLWKLSKEECRNRLAKSLKYKRIQQVQKILDFYNIDLPIYSTFDGGRYKSIEEVISEVYGEEEKILKD